MAYEEDRNFGRTTDYNRTVVERDSSGVTWVVIGLLLAAIVAAIFFLFRPGDTVPGTVVTDPAISTPAEDGVVPDPAPMAPADDFDAAPAGDAAPDAAPAEVAPAPADDLAPAPAE